MTAVAYNTEYGNFITIGNEISAALSPAFVNASIGMNLVYNEQLSGAAQAKKFRKSGSLIAETLAESEPYVPSASSELTDTSITCTAIKAVNICNVSVEAEEFASSSADKNRIAQEQGRALARAYDAALVALFTGFSSGITATTILTIDDLLDAQYTIFNAKTPPGRLAFIGDYKGVKELGKEVIHTTASAFTNPNFLGLVGAPAANNFKGVIADIEVYQTSGLGTSGSDDIAAVFHPSYAFCGVTKGTFRTEVSPFKSMEGFYTSVASMFFYDIKEWNDGAGCKVLSDT